MHARTHTTLLRCWCAGAAVGFLAWPRPCLRLSVCPVCGSDLRVVRGVDSVIGLLDMSAAAGSSRLCLQPAAPTPVLSCSSRLHVSVAPRCAANWFQQQPRGMHVRQQMARVLVLQVVCGGPAAQPGCLRGLLLGPTSLSRMARACLCSRACCVVCRTAFACCVCCCGCHFGLCVAPAAKKTLGYACLFFHRVLK